ncbi:unnamed protein product [Rhodiola kirilowii]
MAEEEELLAEIEAVQAVYGEDCVVVERFPPHIRLHIKPRTADVSSEQFVEAVITIRAGSKYPDEPPHIDIVDSKGLDEERKTELVTSVRNKASELASYLMLVALCEEAVEKLSDMNHPEGDCPLCLCPLFPEDEDDESLPFMKLMSCFHCFHSECIIRWWNWLQVQNNLNPSKLSNQQDKPEETVEGMGTCPVCRKVFHTKDFEHVLSLVGTKMSELNVNDSQIDDEILQLESERARRQKFEAILKKQEENSGLIEPPKDLVVLPGMYLPLPTPSLATTLTREEAEGQNRNPTISRNKTRNTTNSRNKTAPEEIKTSDSSSNKPGPSHRRNHPSKNRKTKNFQRPAKQWVQKASDPTS